MSSEPGQPSFTEAVRFWAYLGFISFGGPAGQIAILHRECVDRRRWIGEREFTDALNFCMLLPGPEALQLAIYIGWKLHGVRGGLAAGLGFIVPAVVLLFALSYVYVLYGEVGWIAGVLFGLKAAVIALVLQALLRIGRRALATPLHRMLAVAAFAALEFAHVPFPWILAFAAALGAVASRQRNDSGHLESRPGLTTASQWSNVMRTAAIGGLLWLAPLAILAASLGFDSLWSAVYLYFTKAAFVTFGGAYAVLGYVTTDLVEHLRWITARQSVAGLALAETTPGPLIIVLQFLGFMTGWNQPGSLTAASSALLAGTLATWATFLPSFLFIFVGGPHIERLARKARIRAALGAITAAVVGVIATLALLLAKVILFPDGWTGGVDWRAAVLSVAAGLALEKFDWPLPFVLAACALGGSVLRLL